MMKGKSPYLILIAGVILLILAGIFYSTILADDESLLMLIPWAKQAPSSAPKISLDALPSLGQLADSYPELAPILRDSELGSIYKDFLIILQDEGLESAFSKAEEWGMITPDGKSLRVTLILDTEDHDRLTSQLEAAGLAVVSAYENQINVGIPIALIKQQLESDNPGEIFQQLSELEHVIAVRFPQTKETNNSEINGEGIEVIGADVWHEAGYKGSGLRIGVLDLGFAGYEDLLGKELPDQVGFAQFGWFDPDEVHGAACAEIIHEVAPDASLFFAWYDGSDSSFGDAVEWLLDQDVDIISHSAGTPVTARDGNNFDARIVDEVVADGILWVNSSGNDGERHYRSTYYDPDGDGLHDFENGEETLPVYNRGYVDVFLIWNDEWSSAAQDYDLAAYDQDGNLLEISRDTQDGSYGSYPTEMVKVDTGGDTIYVAVISTDTTEDAVIDIFVRGYNASVPYGTPQYSVGSPGDAKGSLTVGATSWRTDALEPYSSQGPTTDERLKPDISAPTGVSGATYGSYGFDGTSASTPYVAAASALVWQAHPDYTRQQVIDFLLNESIDFGASGPDTGYGVGRLQLPSPDTIIEPSPSTTTEVPTATPTSEGPLPTPTKGELGSSLSPDPTSTSRPEPTSTQVVYVTLEPEYPTASNRVGRAALLGALILGPGCGGAVLVLVGIVAMVRPRKPTIREQTYPSISTPRQVDVKYPPSSSRQRPHSAQPSPRDYPEARKPVIHPSPADRSQSTPQKKVVKICPNCGSPQKYDAMFCRKCGAELSTAAPARICPHCGSEILSRSRFCPKCGKPL
jgi:predicted RNA-binding Zn-ribbon protein involved in translation (DUF1610 family)